MTEEYKQFQRDQAKILACITVIIDTIDDNKNIKVEGQLKVFYNKLKQTKTLGENILHKVYKQKELSSSTFINDFANKVDDCFLETYKQL